MSFNGAGVYSLTAGQPVVTGTVISSTTFNTLTSDIATAFNTTFCRDGQATATANFAMGGFKLTGLGAGTASGHSLRYEQLVGAYQPISTAVLLSTFTTAGDTIQATGAGAVARLGIGAAGGILQVNSGATALAYLAIGTAGQVPTVNAGATALRYVSVLGKAIYGLTYDVGTDTVNDCNINTGGAMDATGAYWMTLATALGKQSDVGWSVGGTTGAPAGWLDTGAVGNSDYYIWLIARSDTGVVDSLCSLSSTAPTMPANYDYKRLIGWFKRVGGTIVAFHTYEIEGGGIEMHWDVPTLDISLANTLTTSRRTDAVKVPLNLSVIAHLRVNVLDAGVAGAAAIVTCPDEADAAPNLTIAPGLSVYQTVIGSGHGAEIFVRTSATGTVASRANIATIDTYSVITAGFFFARRT